MELKIESKLKDTDVDILDYKVNLKESALFKKEESLMKQVKMLTDIPLSLLNFENKLDKIQIIKTIDNKQ